MAYYSNAMAGRSISVVRIMWYSPELFFYTSWSNLIAGRSISSVVRLVGYSLDAGGGALSCDGRGMADNGAARGAVQKYLC